MGRIEDALKRAAEANQDNVGLASQPFVGTGVEDDVETLAREAFPIELDEHRRAPRPVPASAQPSSSVQEPVTRVHPHRDTTATPVVANVPLPSAVAFDRIDASLVGKIVVDAEMSPVSREQYRRMAATLHHAQASHGLKVVMVTSATMGEGKSLTSSNLALTLSESYKKNVLLIDGDLRRPALHTMFKIDGSPGLSEGLFAGEDQRLAVRQVTPRLGVLTAGRASSDPIAGLTSPRMKHVIEEAREAFDWVIIDTPPVALLPDANLLVAMADGAILVVRAGATPYDLAQRAVQAIGRDRVLGVVLNRSDEPSHDKNYGYYDYYTAPGSQVPSP